MTPWLDDGDVCLYLGDCIEVMAAMPAESVDAVVCDPPYGLEFMGKEWDAPWKDSRACIGRGGDVRGKQAPVLPQAYVAGSRFSEWTEAWATEALRILKPGGHLLAFGGTRTFHRLTCGLEDAGFEIRDCLSWLYGSGFPKSLDVSKAIDKAAGAKREIQAQAAIDPFGSTTHCLACGKSRGGQSGNCRCDTRGTPATDAAREWQGWGTALKPAWEPCVVARKPLAGTVAENVQAHGTGALNIDGCRVPHGDDVNMNAVQRQQRANGNVQFGAAGLIGSEVATYKEGGRWPANVALDDDAAAVLDAQSGERGGGFGVRGGGPVDGRNAYALAGNGEVVGYGDTGGASRFYYTAKASRADRNTSGANNTHPTVKPTDLMRWLVRLVTPPGGVVLDPFAGSGSTLVAARAEGVRAIGIERDTEYAAIIRDRLAQLSLFSEGMHDD